MTFLERAQKNTIFILIGVIISLWTIFGIINELGPWNSTEKSIAKIFSKSYEINATEDNIKPFDEPLVVVFANDKNYIDFCTKKFDDYPNPPKKIFLNPPEIRVLEKIRNPIRRVFTFSKYKTVFKFTPSLVPGEEHLGGEFLFIYNTKITDLDGDSVKEIYSTTNDNNLR